MKPLISVITVVFNAEKFIEDAIQSVLKQDYTNIEYIIVDGNSTDSTLEIIKKYEKAIAKWISEPDKGIYDAMNKGVRMCSGDYIIFLNADDYFLKDDSLSKLVDKTGQNVDIVYGNLSMINADGKEIDRLDSEISKYSFYFSFGINQQSSIVKTSLFSKYGCFNTKFIGAADYEWFARVLKHNQVNAVYQNYDISVFRIGGATTKYLLQNYIDGFKISLMHFPFYISVFRVFKLIKDVFKYYLLRLRAKF